MTLEYEIHGDPIQHFDGRGCEFVVLAKDNSAPEIPGHGETVYCKTDHQHSKGCAVALMKAPRVVGQMVEGQDSKGKDILEDVLGKSPMELCEDYFAAQAARQAPVSIALPMKRSKDAEGKDIDVPDKGLSLA